VNQPAAFTGTVGQPSQPQVVTLGTNGIDPLEVESITVSGTDAAMFAVNPGDGTAGTCGPAPFPIPAGGNCTISIVFTPTSDGAKTANLVIDSNATNDPPVEPIAITGTATASTGSDVTATASVNGANGTVSAPTASVANGATASFTLVPDSGFRPSTTVGGTCPAGSLNGNVYTTGALTADCTVTFSFEQGSTPGGESQEMADVVKAFRSVLGKAPLTQEEQARLDVAPVAAPNGTVDEADVVILLRRVVGL
jgi:hypothetical protein